VVITDQFAVKVTLDPQQQFPGRQPYQQVTVQFNTASKMATAVLHPHCKKTRTILSI